MFDTLGTEQLEQLFKCGSIGDLKKRLTSQQYTLLISDLHKPIVFGASNVDAAPKAINSVSSLLSLNTFVISAGALAFSTTVAITVISGILMLWVLANFIRKRNKSKKMKDLVQSYLLAQVRQEIINELLKRRRLAYGINSTPSLELSGLGQAELSSQHLSETKELLNQPAAQKSYIIDSSEVKISRWRKAEIFFEEGFVNVTIPLFVSFYLSAGYVLTGLGLIAASAATGPIGAGIAFFACLIAGIYVGYNYYKNYRQEKAIKLAVSSLQKDNSDKYTQYRDLKSEHTIQKMQQRIQGLENKVAEKKSTKFESDKPNKTPKNRLWQQSSRSQDVSPRSIVGESLGNEEERRLNMVRSL